MANIILSLTLLLFTSLSSTIQSIEKAFLQNNPQELHALFSSNIFLNISLPEPIDFSEQISSQQAYFLFQRLFSNFTTAEFYTERPNNPAFPKSHILKARWSFKNKNNDNQYVYNIYFFLKKKEHLFEQDKKEIWEITEIMAEKI